MIEIVIIGAGGQGREVHTALSVAARSANLSRSTVIGYLDDDIALHGKTVGGLKVLGAVNQELLVGKLALLGIGYPHLKEKIIRKVESAAAGWPTLVHPTAYLGDRVTLNQGCFVQAGSMLTCDICVAEFVTINIGVTISHDVRIARFATVSPGVHVGGNVSIGEGAFLGIGASIKQGITIGEWAVVGAGAAVIGDVPANSVIVGVPARVITQRNQGWHHA